MDGEAAGATSFRLPATFWSSFHTEYWEQRATVLRALLPSPLASSDEVFERLLLASDGWRADAGGLIPEFFIEHAQVLAGVGDYLPGPDDASVTAWASRVSAMLHGRKFGLVVDDFQVDPRLWWRLREFLRPLLAIVGIPGEQVRATLFLGNYRRTPFGLHRGRPGSFMFVIDGQKRIRAWPDEFFQGKPDLTNRLDYEPYLDASMVLDAEPGDVIYWPSSYWHIGEDTGGWSVAVSLFLFMDDTSAARLTEHVARSVRERLGARRGNERIAPAKAASVRAIPGRVRQALGAVRAVGQEAEVEQALIASRLDHLTGFGFRRLPAPRTTVALRDEQCVRGTPEYPIVWLAAGEDLVVSANGRSFVIPANPRVVALFERLNSGVPCGVGDLVRQHAGTVKIRGIEFEASSADLRSLLERLDSVRALTPAP